MKAASKSPKTPSPSKETAVIAKATLRAAERLGLTAKMLGKVIGVSEPTVSRLKTGAAVLERDGKPFELSVLFVRLFRALDAMTGGDEAVARVWLASPNLVFNDAPINRIMTIAGLLDVIAYLDARRAIV
ncbi:MbcA/ParS/Xre antitoxin family protein [Rhodoblastus acidophilus]|uniref:MbcA/ParS/Xre antitoxin family protein n=1 Tax=Rhodoblastus acidophilus TaxID=1074 RepID=UPI002224830E|nr:MbcA/ParS/Xre antitoxin family protein [Rhodoblastus acidophilus]